MVTSVSAAFFYLRVIIVMYMRPADAGPTRPMNREAGRARVARHRHPHLVRGHAMIGILPAAFAISPVTRRKLPLTSR